MKSVHEVSNGHARRSGARTPLAATSSNSKNRPGNVSSRDCPLCASERTIVCTRQTSDCDNGRNTEERGGMPAHFGFSSPIRRTHGRHRGGRVSCRADVPWSFRIMTVTSTMRYRGGRRTFHVAASASAHRLGLNSRSLSLSSLESDLAAQAERSDDTRGRTGSLMAATGRGAGSLTAVEGERPNGRTTRRPPKRGSTWGEKDHSSESRHGQRIGNGDSHAGDGPSAGQPRTWSMHLHIECVVTIPTGL